MESAEASPRIHVGRAALEGNLVRYARSFNLLEVTAEPGRHPRRPGLLKWRQSVDPDFVFVAVIPASLATLEATPDAASLLAHAKMVADALGAKWWLLRTPASVMPSPRSMRKLETLVQSLRDDARNIAWEPRGLWEDTSATRLAEQLDIRLVRDLAKENRLDDDPVVYTRLRALGEGARVGAAAAERVLDRLEGAREVSVVVEGTGAGRVRQLLLEAFGAEKSDVESEAESDVETDAESRALPRSLEEGDHEEDEFDDELPSNEEDE